jgi:dTDP-4-dehydrorhamnose 3,5-epimerase
MEIQELNIEGVYSITLKPRFDSRGFFMRTYDKEIMQGAGLQRDWLQENQSRSVKKNIVRGLHFQLPPHAETKLVRCTRGAILDVFADLREGSKTFGKWGSIELSDENHRYVFLPRGIAHGFCTLTDTSEVQYKVDNRYTSEFECGIVWNDPDLGIEWPFPNPELSEKDTSLMSLKTFIQKHNSLKP